jgi:methyl-accepting chemotaxis protein
LLRDFEGPPLDGGAAREALPTYRGKKMLGIDVSGSDSKAVLDALGRSLAIIEFEPDGKIIAANENFCKAMGYELAEIKGQHHRMFVEPDYGRSSEYRDFWAKLGRGEFDAREYKRLGKGGKEVWIQASYNPVLNGRGKVVKVVKAATDVTSEKLRTAEFAGKLNAISRAQAVIEFTPSGEIIVANDNFLNALGYRLEEIKGQHHRMFVEPAYAHSADYREFWRQLNAGEFIAAEFKRFGKGGKEVWIQASYNPIFDMNNKVVKVVKFATDVTERVVAVNEIAAGLSRLADQDLEHQNRSAIPSIVRKAARRLQPIGRKAAVGYAADRREHRHDWLWRAGDRDGVGRPVKTDGTTGGEP